MDNAQDFLKRAQEMWAREEMFLREAAEAADPFDRLQLEAEAARASWEAECLLTEAENAPE